jgi:hypothetical protein
MARYLLLSGTSDGGALRGVKELLLTGACEWDALVTGSGKSGLMTDHATLETVLVDAATKGDLVAIEKAGAALTENVERMAKVAGVRLRELPESKYRKLLMEHVGMYIESVMNYMDGNEKEFMKSESRRSENTLALAAFATEWV